jgi:hypothetical protein
MRGTFASGTRNDGSFPRPGSIAPGGARFEAPRFETPRAPRIFLMKDIGSLLWRGLIATDDAPKAPGDFFDQPEGGINLGAPEARLWPIFRGFDTDTIYGDRRRSKRSAR